jgi:hypothetical protein
MQQQAAGCLLLHVQGVSQYIADRAQLNETVDFRGIALDPQDPNKLYV